MLASDEACLRDGLLFDGGGGFAGWLPLRFRDSSLSLEDNDLGENSISSLELGRPCFVKTTVAYGESIAVDGIDAQQRRKLLLIGAGELDPIHAAGRRRLVDLHLTFEEQAHSVRCFDGRSCQPALDLKDDSNFTASTRPGRPTPLQASQVAVAGDGFRTPPCLD